MPWSMSHLRIDTLPKHIVHQTITHSACHATTVLHIHVGRERKESGERGIEGGRRSER